MNRIALLQWEWKPAGPLVTGYSQNLAQAAGLIERGERKVVNLQTRDASQQLGPAFLASSVKGVFRTAAAWLVERVAQEQGADTFVTCDYGRAVPERQRPRLGIRSRDGLCPICQVFGGAGCLRTGKEVAPSQRQQGRVRFSFNRADDAWHTQSMVAPGTLFAWETVSLNDVPFLSRLAAVLGTMIEATEGAEDLTINSDTLLEGADSHQVYERLRYRALADQISNLHDWAKVLEDDFPYLEVVELAHDFEEITSSSARAPEKRDLYLAALRNTKIKIEKWLGRLEKRPPKELVVERLRSRSDVVLKAQIEPADDFALALLLLAGDLVSSGFFRFGRFTTRGYGVVRLRPSATFVGGLGALLAGGDLTLKPVEETLSGRAVALGLLGRDPLAVVKEKVSEWMH